MFQTQLYREDGQITTEYKKTIWWLQEERIPSTARTYLQNNPYMTLLLNHADNQGRIKLFGAPRQ